MKKITVIIAVMAMAGVFSLAACEKKEAQKPAEQTAPTATAPTSSAPAAPATK